MANAEIAQRLLAECDAFESGGIQIDALQMAIWAHCNALEAMPRTWYSQVSKWEGTLDFARFTESEAAQTESARRIIKEIRLTLAKIAFEKTDQA